MAKDIRETISGKKVFIQIVEKVEDTTSALFTDNPFVNFFNKYYGGGLDSFVDLGFDETSIDTALTISETFGNRLDHIADDFTLTFAKIATEKKTYLGTKDANGTSNSILTVEDPDTASVSVTIGGAPTDLEKLYMTSMTASPTGWNRKNGGARPGKFGLIVGVIDNPSAPTTADNISSIHFLNNVQVVDAGDLKATGGQDIVRTISFEAVASDHYNESVDAQNANTDLNK